MDSDKKTIKSEYYTMVNGQRILNLGQKQEKMKGGGFIWRDTERKFLFRNI